MTIDLPGEYSLTAPRPVPGAHHHHDPAANTLFGFWLYIMSDCMLFASLFATYLCLRNNIAGGPTGKELFDLQYVLIETFSLLISSVTYGFAMVCVFRKSRIGALGWLLITFVFGLAFVGMEVTEFARLISEGNGPNRSAFLSSFFTLVGTHGTHVTFGLIWMAVMLFYVFRRGLDAVAGRRLMCLGLFWHFLDVVWICVYSVVYLLGAV